ncbi:MAG TPA: helix-turn-helix domain-containing protein [Actinomycetota bacterium]
MPTPATAQTLAMLAALDDPVRGRLYRFARRSGRPFTREEAAADAGISRKLAAFHLDKLVDAGLLEASYEPPPGRPRRVGRAPKVYRPSHVEVRVNIPERRYDLLAELLVDALGREPAAVPAATGLASERGQELGDRVRQERRLGRPGAERTLSTAAEVLDGLGFETTRVHQDVLTLRNCPFQALAKRAPDLVCGINRAFIHGLVKGLGNQTVQVLLEPRPDRCCVELNAAPPIA